MSENLNNVAVEPVQVTFGSLDLGLTEGDIEAKMDENAVDVMAHQHGTSILDAIRTGKKIDDISITLKETALAKITSLIQAGGDLAASVAQVVLIDCIADVAGSLNNKYFFINGAGDGVKYLVWFNVNGAGVAPTLPPGYTAVAVAVATGATAPQVATALAAALDPLSAFVATANSNEVTCTNAAVGITSAPSIGNSGFTINVSVAGSNALPGWGTSKDFTSMLAGALKLVFHPVAVASNDLSKDIAFWKAYPKLNSLVWSGEKEKKVTIAFKIFPDLTKDVANRWFVFGNHT